ncbi:MAG: replicative DNA helicase [Rhodospirillaceae bacterium]|jgi:replicative DNA helicase|nr:replicative DNA helicase [Rhodospirillaceae bacterium]
MLNLLTSNVSKEIPNNPAAEQALLGAIFRDNRALEMVSDFLLDTHFFIPLHAKIYKICQTLINKKHLIANPISLKDCLNSDPEFQELGDINNYLVGLLEGSGIPIITVENYGNLIFDLHLRRELINVGENIIKDAYFVDIDNPAKKQIELYESKLFNLAITGQVNSGLQDFQISLIKTVDQIKAACKRGGLSGVTTGLKDLDLLLGGFHKSELLIIAGRPSMGKTALATNIAFSAAKAYRDEVEQNGNLKVVDGAKVAFFSLEMSTEQLVTRILSERTNLSSQKILHGKLSDEEFIRLVNASQDLYELPLYIDDTPALSVATIRTRSRRMARTHGLGMIVIDYLQLLSGSSNTRAENRVLEISEITRSLKALAKELNIPVLALSQLSRQVENREDKRPLLSDLRESGAIEQDADVVMFIFREYYYLSRSEPVRRAEESEESYNNRHNNWKKHCDEVRNKAETIIAKQRNGPTGTIELYFDGNYTSFGNLDRIYNHST